MLCEIISEAESSGGVVYDFHYEKNSLRSSR